MAMFDLSQTRDPSLVQRQQEAGVQQQEANKEKTMQEVFDLSVNNQVQQDTADYMLSPGYKSARAAETQMNLTKSMQVLDDKEHENLEMAFSALGDNPSEEGYGLIRDSMVKMNPILGDILPKKYGPKAMQGLLRARNAYTKTRAHRQKMESAGYDRQTQVGMAGKKYGYDMNLLNATAQAKMTQLRETINSNELMTLLNDESATKRTRMTMEPLMRIGQELLESGDPRGAMMVFEQAAKIKADALMAKAMSGGTHSSVLDERAQKLRKNTMQSVQDGLLTDYTGIGPGYDKNSKAMEASNLNALSGAILDKAELIGVPPEKQTQWVKQRMVLDPSQNRWVDLPTNKQGDIIPLGMDRSGKPIIVTSSDILASIHHDLDTRALQAAGMHWKGSEQIDNLEEALEFYDLRLKLNGHKGLYPGKNTGTTGTHATPTA